MTLVRSLRRHWQEAALTLVLALPWMALLMLGIVWLWQGGHVLAWALASAVLGLLAWPLRRAVKRRADAEARLVLGRKAESSPGWNATEREAWAAVLAIADATPPLSFTETDAIGVLLRSTVEVVAGRFHPDESPRVLVLDRTNTGFAPSFCATMLAAPFASLSNTLCAPNNPKARTATLGLAATARDAGAKNRRAASNCPVPTLISLRMVVSPAVQN